MEEKSPQDFVNTMSDPQIGSLFQRLPFDILHKIVTEYLQLREVMRLSETSHYFYTKIYCQEWLWRYLYCRDISILRFGRGLCSTHLNSVQMSGTELLRISPNWRTEYIRIMTGIKTRESDEILCEAGRNGYERFIENQITTKIPKAQADRIMILAAKGGYQDIVEMMIMSDARNFNEAMRAGASGGHREIVDRMLTLGATTYNETMKAAAEGGYRAIVEQMISLGATRFNCSLIRASRGGHLELVKDLISRGARSFAISFVEAAGNGHRNVVDLLIEQGILNDDYHRSIAGKQYISKHIWINNALDNVASKGHFGMVDYLIELGANNYDIAIYSATSGGHRDVVTRLLPLVTPEVLDVALGEAQQEMIVHLDSMDAVEQESI